MNEIDNTFFEEYKRLDKLCMDLLSSKSGVSEYISQMESTGFGQYYIPSWDNDYKMLKHLRWVRNQIAHDTTGVAISEESDLIMVREFYKRILSGEDPFAQLRKSQDRKKELFPTEKRQAGETRGSIIDDAYYSTSPQAEKKKLYIGFAVGIAVLVLIVVFCIIISI